MKGWCSYCGSRTSGAAVCAAHRPVAAAEAEILSDLTPAERYPRYSPAQLAHIRADLAARDRSRNAGRRHP